VHKGSTQTNKRLKLGIKFKGAKKPSVPWSDAPDCPVRHRTVSDPPGPYRVQTTTLGFQPARSAIIHRTVWCTGGVTSTSCNSRLQKLKNRGTVRNYARQSRAQSQRHTGHWTWPVWCGTGLLVPLEDKASNGQKLPNPNGWVTWLAHRTVRCAHRQQPPPTVGWWLRAINTPNHHHSKHPSFQHFTFNTRASAFTPRHISKISKPLQV
jgi:hypothetical protein